MLAAGQAPATVGGDCTASAASILRYSRSASVSIPICSFAVVRHDEEAEVGSSSGLPRP
jgi:hypothetical protein